MTRNAMLSDEMWAGLEPLLPPVKGAMGRPATPHRPVIEGILYRYRTGVAWRDVPREFGPWQTLWKRHAKFTKDGTWDRVLTTLQARADAEGEIDWRLSIDSSVMRVHQHGATAARGVSGPSSLTGGSVELQGSGAA